MIQFVRTFAEGVRCQNEIIDEVRDEGATMRTGTRIRFTPDFEIFARRPWDLEPAGLLPLYLLPL